MEKYGNINSDSVCCRCGSPAAGTTDENTPYCDNCAGEMGVKVAFSNEQINKTASQHLDSN